ncbi:MULTISPECIES: DUF123 domain-containing protein [Halorussus]|uniref:GIY-YIG nuclease family protein n=1 Tax=Halorussus TaxID=1070314 RepID=UPI000E2192FE|nr:MULTISPECIES: GIY-YIG nuclease family protein [Halorussus]NHN58754.1 GIY-YIG nuclease family protein [Halorussus sp. JP-T4]
MAKGTYTLLVQLAEDATVAFGAAGERDLVAGWYAYTGSAFGTGGFARVERHRELAAGERDARRWHVDYLLGHPASRIADVVKTRDEDIECAVNRGIEADERAKTEAVAGLGASDCNCDSHLQFAPDHQSLARAVRRAHDAAADGA